MFVKCPVSWLARETTAHTSHVRVFHSLIQILRDVLVQDSSDKVLSECRIHFLCAINKDILVLLALSFVVAAIILTVVSIVYRGSKVQVLVIVGKSYLVLVRVWIVFFGKGGGWL